MQGLTDRLRDETQMPVHLAESPLACVAVGSGKYLEELDALGKSKRTSQSRVR
ncbi:MAG TPA: rod shape-determining protein [Thermoleophilia bacterium]|nr:rod shape-determining protein [Thermoleophilia bacterium]